MPRHLINQHKLPSGYVPVKRIDCTTYTKTSLMEEIEYQCITNGKPLIISNMSQMPGWNTNAFSLEYFKQTNWDQKIVLTIENVPQRTVRLGEYIETLQYKYNLPSATKKTAKTYLLRTKDTYAKDVECPDNYREAISQCLPERLLSHGSNDLMGLLPESLRATNLMCYIGQDGTSTPMHKDLCGAIGHNIMTMGSTGAYSEWVFVLHEDQEKLASGRCLSHSDYLESNRFWVTERDIRNSRIQAYVAFQKPGDLVIVPSRAMHQVTNIGLSVKVAWNRVTAQTLVNAFDDQLDGYHKINHPETFRSKATVFYSLKEWYKKKISLADLKDIKKILDIFFDAIISPEWLDKEDEKNVIVDGAEDAYRVTCNYCFADIFFRYYHCDTCSNYDVCLNCYVVGRSCPHPDQMKMREGNLELEEALNLYKRFVKKINIRFKHQYFEDRSNTLNSGLSNLATKCKDLEYKRLEMKRQPQCPPCHACATSYNTYMNYSDPNLDEQNRGGPSDEGVPKVCYHGFMKNKRRKL